MAGAGMKETFFVPHGAPLLVTDDSFPARKFLQSFRDIVFTHKPTSILVVSTHWGTSESTINANSGSLETIYDFFGFPEELYKLKYPAKGAPELAKKVQELLLESGLPKVNVDDKRGLDHGAWIPLMLMYPEADIPVCQLSIVPTMDAAYHYNLGKALAPLKDQGVLIVCSGGATDTKSRRLGSKEVAPWAEEFDSWLEDTLVAGRFEDVKQYKDKAPHVELAHPSPDHLYPLHVAMGAAGENARAELIHRSWNAYTVSYASYKFTSSSAK